MTSLQRGQLFLRLRLRHLVRRLDFRLLLSLLALLALVSLFWEIAEMVEHGTTQRIDERILLWFRTPPPELAGRGPPWVPGAVRDLTALGSSMVLVTLVIAVSGYFSLQGRWRTGLFFLITTSLGWLVMDEMKEHYNRTRPTVVPHLMPERSLSFPSGHAKMSAVVYLTLAALLAQRAAKRAVKLYWLGLGIFLTLLIGTSRVYLGVHYPSDVMAGWLAGAAWAILAFLAARLWTYRHLVWAVKHKEEYHGDGPRG